MALFLVGPLAVADAATLTLNDPTVTEGDRFGISVAIDGGKVLVGSYHDDTRGNRVGQAHLFDVATGDLLQTFNDPTITDQDHFGGSVAIDGDNVLIGAFYDSTQGSHVGQAHLFDAVTGNLLRTFDDPTITTSDLFGVSVAIDGNNVLIGAYQDDTLGSDVGQAHLFDVVTGMLLHTFDDPTVTDKDWFGHSVAIDGDKILIGDYVDKTTGTSVGQAHLFDAVTGNFLRTFNDPTPTSVDLFGVSVALDNDKVLIGAYFDTTGPSRAGQAHLFDALTGNLLHTFDDPTITDQDWFGISVALDGNNVLIGASSDDTNGTDVGQAHLFDAVTGNLLRTFDGPAISDLGFFGNSVALDGNNVLIGAYNTDAAGNDVGQAFLFTIIPEPSSVTLAALALLGLLAVGHRRRRA